MMDQLRRERLATSNRAAATAEHAVPITSKHAKERNAFCRDPIEFQNTRFKPAECATEAHIGCACLDVGIQPFVAGLLDPVATAKAKCWLTGLQCRALDECLQLHGGYGHLAEHPIGHMWADSRLKRIYSETGEIRKKAIGAFP